MDYREIVLEDVAELAKIYAETFNSDPWYDKWTQKTAERRLYQMANNGGFFGETKFYYTPDKFYTGTGEAKADDDNVFVFH